MWTYPAEFPQIKHPTTKKRGLTYEKEVWMSVNIGFGPNNSTPINFPVDGDVTIRTVTLNII
jgi:hypothetical protein